MRAITIQQPYAELIADGVKRVENRAWRTAHRGTIAIHAGKGTAFLRGASGEGMTFGAVVAVARIEAVTALIEIPELVAARTELGWLMNHEHVEGPICWVLGDVRRIEPVPVGGERGLWELPGATAQAVRRALSAQQNS